MIIKGTGEFMTMDELLGDGEYLVVLGEKNNGKRHTLSKLAINYILDREYEKAKQILVELMEVE